MSSTRVLCDLFTFLIFLTNFFHACVDVLLHPARILFGRSALQRMVKATNDETSDFAPSSSCPAVRWNISRSSVYCITFVLWLRDQPLWTRWEAKRQTYREFEYAVSTVTTLWAEWPKVRVPARARHSTIAINIQSTSGGWGRIQPSIQWVPAFSPGVKAAGAVNLTTHHLVLR